MSRDNLIANINACIKKETLQVCSTQNGDFLAMLKEGGRSNTFSLYSKTFAFAFRIHYKNHFQEMLGTSEIQEVVYHLETYAYENKLDHELSRRIYNQDNSQILYDLNCDTGSVVWIENGKCSIEYPDDWLFKRSDMFQNQVEPDFKVSPKKLPEYVKKHFNLKSEEDVKLLSLYLVTSFWGLIISHPMLVLVGEKGSSKSTTLRKLEKLIDPKHTDLTGIPKGNDGLELRLSNSYYVTLDNISYISRSTSDTLARAVTGGSITKRALYENTKEVSCYIKAVIAMNGVNSVVRESDLLDRTLMLNLKRIKSTENKTELQIWKEFDKDIPKILGCCFQCLATALNNTEAIEITERIRLADFHEACIRAGRVLEYTEDEVTELLLKNQNVVNKEAIHENLAAECLVELMKDRRDYKEQVSVLLEDLREIAEENHIHSSALPKVPNHLTRQLNKVKSNLQQQYGITFQIVNVGAFREIRIKKSV